MVNLQDSISKLVRWFSALNDCIKFIAEEQVDPFLKTITRAATGGLSDASKIKVGKITFSEFQRTVCGCGCVVACTILITFQCIYNGALTIRAYFGIFTDVAVMWNQMSIENIFPGLKLVQELSVQDNETKDHAAILKSKCARLNTWTDGASKNIRGIASKVRLYLTAMLLSPRD
jgi:hypothetical protein